MKVRASARARVRVRVRARVRVREERGIFEGLTLSAAGWKLTNSTLDYKKKGEEGGKEGEEMSI